VQQLLDADLVDELQLFVHPLVLVAGHTLFPRHDRPVRLELQSVDRTATGVVSLTYLVAPSFAAKDSMALRTRGMARSARPAKLAGATGLPSRLSLSVCLAMLFA